MTDPARFAGTWYPAAPDELTTVLERYLEAAQRSGEWEMRDGTVGAVHEFSAEAVGALRGAVLPHAGLSYSGPGMARFFGALRDQVRSGVHPPRRVVLLSPSHYFAVPQDTLIVGAHERHETPIGDLAGDEVLIRDLTAQFDAAPEVTVYRDDEAIAGEHGLEMLFPFLRYLLADVTVIPIVVGPLSDPSSVHRAAALLGEAFSTRYGARWRGETLLIASSDFTHYGSRFRYTPFGTGSDAPARVREVDLSFARLAAAGAMEPFLAAVEETKPTICGRYPIALLLSLLEGAATRGRTVYYGTSLDTDGSATTGTARGESFVAYASVVFRDASGEEA